MLNDVNKAESLSQVFNENLEFHSDLMLLDVMVKEGRQKGFKKAYMDAINTIDLSEVYHYVLGDKDLDTFIKTYAGSSCSIRHAMPVIHYLVTRYDLKDALYYNVLVGGSISERAGFIYYLLGD